MRLILPTLPATSRLLVTALTLALPAAPLGLAATGAAYAQSGPDQDAPKQVKLTQAQIDGLLAAQPDVGAAQAKAQQGPSGDIDPKVAAKIEKIVKAHGFSGLDDFGAVSDSVGIVLAGIDPETKTYVGPSAVIRKQIAQVQADKSMAPRDRTEALKELKEALAAGGTPKPLPANIDLVVKNFDKLSQVFQGGD